VVGVTTGFSLFLHLIGDEIRDLGTAEGRRSCAENGVGLDEGGYS